MNIEISKLTNCLKQIYKQRMNEKIRDAYNKILYDKPHLRLSSDSHIFLVMWIDGIITEDEWDYASDHYGIIRRYISN